MFSSDTPVQTCRKSFRAFTNQLVNRNNTHNQQPHTQQHQQDRQPPSEEFINTNSQQPQATVNNNGIGGQQEDQQLPSASLILVRAQFKLLDHLGISKLFASVGSSMGGMQSIVTAWLKPQRAQRMKEPLNPFLLQPSTFSKETFKPAVMDSRTSLKAINDSNNVQNQSLRVKARGPLKDNRRSGKLLMEETLEERLAQGLSTGGTSEDPGQTVGLDNGCKQSPETDWYGCDSIQQTLLSQEDQKDEYPVK
ncbi:hypothetical protein PPACK8108_LOCUS19322 [Phakopsora pachyrhizi]|uniref:Uncharacterized protein n=1 Tax=Phakopsora pachyrhizi TaxID=170000 RepID=A0AAV0BDD6_PHAPC|nr:hypothetical protein PPACK8108_LOCUS19322 [Phakopsora pachyrhizi]